MHFPVLIKTVLKLVYIICEICIISNKNFKYSGDVYVLSQGVKVKMAWRHSKIANTGEQFCFYSHYTHTHELLITGRG